MAKQAIFLRHMRSNLNSSNGNQCDGEHHQHFRMASENGSLSKVKWDAVLPGVDTCPPVIFFIYFLLQIKNYNSFFCVTQIIIIATKRNLWVQSFQHSPQFDWPKRGKAKSFRILWLERNLATMLFSKFVVVGYARWKKAKMRHELDRNQWGVPEVEERRPWRRSYSGSCRSLRLVNEGMKKKQLQS